MLLKKKIVPTKSKLIKSFTPPSASFKNPTLTKQNLSLFLKENYQEPKLNISSSSLQPTKSFSRTQSLRSTENINISVDLGIQKDIISQTTSACSQPSTLSSQQLNEKTCKEAYKKFIKENKKYDSDFGDILNSPIKKKSSKKLSSFESESVVSEPRKVNAAKQYKKNKTQVDQENICDSGNGSLSQEFLNDPQIKKVYSDFIKTKLSQGNKDATSTKEKFTKTVDKNVEKKRRTSSESNNKSQVKKKAKNTDKKISKNKYLNKTKRDKIAAFKRSSSLVSNSYREKLISDLELRDVGLYVFCDRCNKTRYLPHVKDPLELPKLWYCKMNPDKNYNSCNSPNFELPPEDEEKTIKNLYNAGSVVWARMDGYPWWPAMVDDDPDTEDFFWVEEDQEEPSWYHVTFFDEQVSRAWMRPSQLAPFKINRCNKRFTNRNSKYQRRLNVAMKQAQNACDLKLLDRLRKYSFVVRYDKPIKKPNDLVEEKGKKKSNFKIYSSESNEDSFEDITSEIMEKMKSFDDFSECNELSLFDNL